MSKILIGASHNLSFKRAQKPMDNGERPYVASFLLDGHKVTCNTWDSEVPKNYSGILIDTDTVEDAQPFETKDSEGNTVTRTPRAGSQFCSFEGWEIMSRSSMIEAMKDSGLSINM